MTYPFEPKSTNRLEPGHFWALPLSNGTYGAAVVLSPGTKEDGSRHSRLFIAGLLDWNGKTPPGATDLQRREIAKSGVAHIRAIQRTGGAILGLVNPGWPVPPVTDVFRYMPVWGFEYAQVMAERHFVSGLAWEMDLSGLAKLPQVVVGSGLE
jgi:hypothetical protein